MTRKDKQIMWQIIIEAAIRMKGDGFDLWAVKHIKGVYMCWAHNTNCSQGDRNWRCLVAGLKHMIRQASKNDNNEYRLGSCLVKYQPGQHLSVIFSICQTDQLTTVSHKELRIFSDEYLDRECKKYGLDV